MKRGKPLLKNYDFWAERCRYHLHGPDIPPRSNESRCSCYGCYPNLCKTDTASEVADMYKQLALGAL